MELQPILHVWKHADNDLIDLTITTTHAQHGKPARHKPGVPPDDLWMRKLALEAAPLFTAFNERSSRNGTSVMPVAIGY
jgi:hypothetical protein